MPQAAVAADGSRPLGPDESEVCGIGRVKTAVLDDPRELKIPVQQAVDSLTGALAKSPQEVLRAAGLAVQSAGLSVAFKQSPECDGAACAPKVADATPPVQGQAQPAASAAPREALARMAVATRSPQVYALALQACGPQRGQGNCAMLSTDQWARLDPDNAIPWLQVATDARLRGDNAGVDEALFRMSRATISDARFGAVTALAAAHMPGDVTLLAKHVVVTALMGVESAAVLPGYQVVTQYCSAANVRDANRQQTCSALADVLVKRGTTMLDLSVGVVVGERAGWPAERVQAVRDERDAMAQISVASQPEPRSAWSCEALGKTTRYLGELVMYGEAGALRRAIKQSGQTVSVMAAQQRESLARATAAASSASSATP
jgi:hypothetical protein